MRKAIIVLFVCFLGLFTSGQILAQNVAHTAFSTNGPVGETLFSENENGDIVYTGIVETPYPADTVLGLAKEYLYTIEKKYKARVGGRFEGVRKWLVMLSCRLGQGLLMLALPGHGQKQRQPLVSIL